MNKKHIDPFVAGCGTRKQGKSYLVSNMKKHLENYPFEYFIFDPPVVIDDLSSWGICPQGLSYIQQNGVWHVLDWIGVGYYPNVADVLEEAFQRFGSTLTPLQQTLERLEPGKSRRLLVHPRGHIVNPEEIKKNRVKVPKIRDCFLPNGDMQKFHTQKNNQMCAGLHWQYVIPNKNEKGEDSKRYKRSIGTVSYDAAFVTSEMMDFKPAIVGWLPIDEVHLIDSPVEDEVTKALNFLKGNTNLPIYITNR